MKTTSRVTSFMLVVLGACVLSAPTVSHADLLGDILNKAKSAGERSERANRSREEPAAPVKRPSGGQRVAATDSDPAARFVQGGLRFTILAIDNARRSVTALDRTNGGMFRFSVNAAVINKLKTCERFDAELDGITVGKSFNADFPAAKGTPCCTLATAMGGAGQALGVRESSKNDGIDVILLGLKRTNNDTVRATWQICNGSKENGSFSYDDRDRHTYLLDPATQTKHTMVKDGAGRILISSSYDQPRPNQPLKNWVEFSAPESDVVTVVLPNVEPFEGVSLVAPTSLAPPPQ